MADVNANIGIHIDSSAALAELKALQRQLATFHASIAKNSAASAAAQKGLQQNLLNAINATGQFHAQMGLVRTSTESFTHALENNKLSMREYFRYAGASTKSFGKLFKSEFDTIGKVAEERVRKMQTQYVKMGRDANGAMKAMSVTPTTLNMKDLGNQTAVTAQKQALFNQLIKQGSTSLLNFGKNTQWAGRQLTVGFSVPLLYIGSIASKTFMDMEAQAIRFKRVYGDMFTTSGETDKALKDIENLAKSFTKYGVAVSKTMEMAASAAAMGKTGSDLTAQVAQATRLAILGGVEQEQALETTISLTNAFGVATEDLTQKINFLNAVENQTVVSIEDLTIAIPKAGPVVQQLGGDVEDLAFFLTAMKEGGINASEGANALKSGLASLINPTKKASEMLAGLGINIKAIVEKNAGNISETVVDFAQALNQLDPLNRARAIEQLFGKFQFARLSTLFQNVTKDGTQASRVLSLAGKSVEELAILSERELKTVEDAVGVNFKAAIEDLKVSIMPIGKTFLEALTPIVKFAAEILKKFDGLGDGTKKFIVVATTLVGILGPTLLMTFGLVANGAANIIKLFLALRTGFLKLTGNTTVLSQQTSYLNAEQLEAATVAASLNQAHTRLTQSFTLEASAVHALRNAYVQATAAALTFARANPGMMMPGFKGSTPKKFARGATYVPGSGNKDTVPSMLTPGEAVIPRDVAQNPAYQPIIDAMVNGNIQGFEFGSTGVNYYGREYNAKSARGAKGIQTFLSQLIEEPPGTLTHVDPKTKSETTFTKTRLLEVLDSRFAKASENKFTLSEIKEKLAIGGAKKGSGISSSKGWINRLTKEAGYPNQLAEQEAIEKHFKDNKLNPSQDQRKNLFQAQAAHVVEEVGPDGQKVFKAKNITPDSGWSNNYINTVKGKLGQDLLKMTDAQLSRLGIDRESLSSLVKGDHPTTAKLANTLGRIAKYHIGIDPKNYQAHAVVAGMDYRNTTGFYPATGARKTIAELFPQNKNVIAEILKNADPGGIFAATDENVKNSKFKDEPVTKYGKRIQPTSGYSFKEANHLGGIYQKPDGSRVFVKPMMTEDIALAEQRLTEIGRRTGLQTPEQTLKVIQDPATGKKLFALESPYNKAFDPATISTTFTQDDYFKQVVAAGVRGDTDLKKGNLGGNVLTDVGRAGVLNKASGMRYLTTDIPSIKAIAEKNLGGVSGPTAGGSPQWFGNATVDIAKNMTSDVYNEKMIAEINRQEKIIQQALKDFALTPEERPYYDNMLKRLREAKGVDWRELHKRHTSIVIKPDEMIEDTKTGKLTKPKTTSKPAGVRSSSKNPKDTKLTAPPAKGKRVVQRPALRGPRGIIIRPGFANAGISQAELKASSLMNMNPTQLDRHKAAMDSGIKALVQDTAQTKNLTESKKALYGKINTGVNIFSGLTIAASFAGGSLGEIAQKLAPLGVILSTLLMMGPSLKSGFLKLLPLLSNPFVLLAAAALALVVGFKVIQARNNKIATATSKYIDQISATTEKMKEVSKVTKTVGASEIMATRRENGTSEKYLTGFNRAGQQFGTSFLDSEVGKSIFNTFKENLIKGGVNAAKTISLELSAYVSDGIMTAEDANSVARSIGISLSDMTISSDIQGYLRKLLGPNGEDLLKDPLKVRLNIGNEQIASSSQFLQTLKDSNFIDIYTSKDLERAAAVAASYTQTLEIIQAQRDAQSNMYDEQIRVLEAQLKTTKDKQKQYEIESKIEALRGNQGTDDIKLAKQKQQALQDQIAAFNYTESKGNFLRPNQVTAAFMKSGQEQVKTKWEGDPWVEKFLQRSAETGGKYTDELEVVINAMVGDGDLSPKSGIALLEMFGTVGNREREAELKTLLTTTLILQDPGKVQELVNLTTGIKGDTDKKIGIDLFTKISAEGEEAKFDDRLNALKVLSALDGKEISLKAFLKGDALGKIDELIPQLNKVEEQKTINKNILLELQKTEGMPDLTELSNSWEYYANLPDDVKKTATQTFITIKKTIEDTGGYTSAQQEAEARGLKGVAAEAFITKYSNDPGKLAASINQRLYESLPPPKRVTTPRDKLEDDLTHVASRDTTLDDLFKQLRFVRDAAIKAKGDIKDLAKLTAGSGITKFTGLSQQLMAGTKGGYNRDFITMLGDMDDAMLASYVNVKKLKQGIVQLLPAGKDLKELLNAKDAGMYQNEQIAIIQNSTAQQAAFVKLKAAGVDSATALEMTADAVNAVRINSSKVDSKKIQELYDVTKRAKIEAEGLARAFEQTFTNSRKDINKATDDLKTLAGAKDFFKFSSEDLKIVGDRPELLNMVKRVLNGDGTDQQLRDFAGRILETIANIKGVIEITANTDKLKQSIEEIANNVQSKFDAAMSNIQKLINFEVMKVTDIWTPFTEAADAAVAAVQAEIDDTFVVGPDGVATKIKDGLQTTFDKASDAVNNATKVYDKSVEGINSQFEIDTASTVGKIKEINDAIKTLETTADISMISMLSIAHAFGDVKIGTQIDIASKSLADANLFLANVQARIEKEFTKPIEMLQQEIALFTRVIEVQYNRAIEKIQKEIEGIQRNIAVNFEVPLKDMQEESSKLSEDLAVIDKITESINDKYKVQEDALAKVAEINQDIVEQQKQQLGLADALSKGDISAAAAAVQEMRATQAAKSLGAQQGTLGKAKEAEINAIRSTSGLTKDQISERQYAIERASYRIQQLQAIEQEKILALQENIYRIENSPGRLEYLNAIKSNEDKVYNLELSKQTINNALYSIQTQIEAKNAAINVQQVAAGKLEDDLAKAQDARDAILKQAQADHTANMIGLNKALTDAEAALEAAQKKLADAQAKADAVNKAKDAAIAAAAKSMKDQFTTIENGLLDAEAAAILFKTQLGLANDAAILLADNYKTLQDLKDQLARDVLGKVNVDPATKLKQEQEDKNKAAAGWKGTYAEGLALNESMLKGVNPQSVSGILRGKGYWDWKDSDAITLPPPPTVIEHKGTYEEGLALNSWLKGNDQAKEILKGMGYYNYGGLIPKMFAAGGFSKGTDTVPAMLTPGEFVIKKAAVDKYGVDTFKDLNMQRFAIGGEVTGGKKAKAKVEPKDKFDNRHITQTIGKFILKYLNPAARLMALLPQNNVDKVVNTVYDLVAKPFEEIIAGSGTKGDYANAALSVVPGSAVAKVVSKIPKILEIIEDTTKFVHYAHVPITETQPAIGKVTNGMAQYGTGTYGSIVPEAFKGDTFGEVAHQLSLTPLAWVKTVMGNGVIKSDEILAKEAAKFAEKTGETVTSLIPDNKFAAFLSGKGYTGYAPPGTDIMTNWNVGSGGVGLKNFLGKVPQAVAKIAEAAPKVTTSTISPGKLKQLNKLIDTDNLIMAKGGLVPGLGNKDTIPAMLTPGEFVIKKSAAEAYGAGNLAKINNGTSTDSSVYNYSLSVNVNGNNLNPDDIASTVMQKIKYIDGQRVRGQR